MKAPGSIRLGNKRAGAPGKPGPGEIAVDIDRKNRILGNPFVLHDPTDAAARNDVIERIRAKYEADLKCDGPMSAATEALARTRPKGRAPGLHVLVLAEAAPRRRHHRRDQTAPRMRSRTTGRSRKEREPLLAILGRPRYIPHMPPPKWIKPQLCKLAAKPRADPCGSMKSSSTATASPPGRNLRRRGAPPRRLPTWPRKRRLQAYRSPLSPRRPRRLDQIQVPQSRRIRHRRLVGPGTVAALPGLTAARPSRRSRPVALRRPRRNRHVASARPDSRQRLWPSRGHHDLHA